MKKDDQFWLAVFQYWQTDMVAAIKKAEQQLNYLNLLMPNGKRVGDCTYEELAKFGQWFAAVGEAGAAKAERRLPQQRRAG
jgi:hypothetical protein